MGPQQEYYLNLISDGPCMPGEYARDYYGLTWPLTPETATALDQYRARSRRPSNCPRDAVSRFDIEGLMSHSGVLTRKWMGARLGMTVEAIGRLLDRLELFGMQRQRYVFGPDFVADALHEDLIRNVPGMRFRTFADHNDYCERLHAELNKAGVPLTHADRLFCATSTILGEHPRRFALHFDCITLEPLSATHSVWLDFRKPLNLPPDRCSKLFYAEHRERLRPYLAGTSEPEGLAAYEAFLAGQHG